MILIAHTLYRKRWQISVAMSRVFPASASHHTDYRMPRSYLKYVFGDSILEQELIREPKALSCSVGEIRLCMAVVSNPFAGPGDESGFLTFDTIAYET